MTTNQKKNSLRDLSVTVTGGAGLIGSFLCDELVKRDARVRIVDDFSKGERAHLDGIASDIELMEGNLEDPSVAADSFAGSDVVFHLASRAYGVGYGEGHHLETLRHNEAITNNVLAACERHRIGRFVTTSSSCVYDDNGPDTVDERPLFEGDPEQANRGYGWAKRYLESKVSLYARETGMSALVVRPFNIFGERYRWVGQYSQAIPMLTKRILDGEDPVVIWGSGRQRRSYIHAHDCARMILALFAAGHHSSPVNIGTEETIEIRQLVDLICEEAGVSPTIECDTSKPEGRFVKSADMRFFNKIAGEFEMSISMRDGIRRMIGWYAERFAANSEKSGTEA